MTHQIVQELEHLRAALKTLKTKKTRSIAGFVLGSLPKKPKRVWTGWIQGVHYWRGRRVILPDGSVGSVYGAVRNQVIVRLEDPLSILGFADRVYSVDELRVFKIPAAMELGKGKRGIQESKSERKAAAARINGCAPVRLGNRPRGRPRKHWDHSTPEP